MGKPEIRFKGYTDEWEQRKLGDVCLLMLQRSLTKARSRMK